MRGGELRVLLLHHLGHFPYYSDFIEKKQAYRSSVTCMVASDRAKVLVQGLHLLTLCTPVPFSLSQEMIADLIA